MQPVPVYDLELPITVAYWLSIAEKLLQRRVHHVNVIWIETVPGQMPAVPSLTESSIKGTFRVCFFMLRTNVRFDAGTMGRGCALCTTLLFCF